jgi:hypothetical protein
MLDGTVPGSEGAAYVCMYVAILHVDLNLVLVELPATCNLCVPFGTTYYVLRTTVLLYCCRRVSSTFNTCVYTPRTTRTTPAIGRL